MAPKKNARGHKMKEAKAQLASKNGKKPEVAGGSSFFTWFMVLALLGVWTSVAVVYFDLVDYQGVIGQLSSYDADGDGDFDVEDAKVLLGLTKDGSQERSDSLEEVPDMLVEEGSDWFQGFFTFLYGLIHPFEDEEGAAEEESAGTSQTDGVQGKSCVILGLHNQQALLTITSSQIPRGMKSQVDLLLL